MSERWRSALVASVVVVATLLGACGSSDPGPAPSGAASAAPTSTGAPAPEVRTFDAVVDVQSRGAVEVDYREPTELTVSVFTPGKVEVSLLTVGLAKERKVGNLAFRAAFDLAGQYHGPDRYTIPAAGSSSGASAISSAFLLTATLADPSGPVVEANVTDSRRFDKAVEPCVVEVADDERTGSLTCPRLEDATGGAIDLRMRWSPA